MKLLKSAIVTAGVLLLSGCADITKDKETVFVEELLKRMSFEE